MSGKLIHIDQFHRKENGGGSGQGGGMEGYNSGLSTDELLSAADHNYFDNEGRGNHDARVRAMMQVLLSDTGSMRDQLRQAAETGGVLRFPAISPFPLRAGSTLFENEEELREFVPGQMADKLMEQRRDEAKTSLSLHCAEATRLMRDLTVIANARLGGASPDEILTPDHLRVALATEMVSQTTLTHIRDTRQKVQTVIAELMKNSGNGVKAAPLAQTMQQIGLLCQTMTQDLDQLSMMAEKAVSHKQIGGLKEKRTHVTALTQQAREVFGPFIKGNHVISMEQLHKLENFLRETGSYNRDIGTLITDGMRAIGQAQNAGRHDEARKIEEFLDFEQQVQGFEQVTRTLDRKFATGASILAYAGASNRTILKSTPPGMLRQAEIESGLLRELLLKGREEELVMPSEDGLELVG